MNHQEVECHSSYCPKMMRHDCCWVLSIQNGSNETVVGVGVAEQVAIVSVVALVGVGVAVTAVRPDCSA